MPVVRRQTFLAPTVVLGGQHPINLDYVKIPFQVSVHVDLVSGTVNYAVEFTTDDITNLLGSSDPSTFRWWSDPAFPAGQTASANFVMNAAVTAVRLNIQDLTGEVRMSVIQGIGV